MSLGLVVILGISTVFSAQKEFIGDDFRVQEIETHEGDFIKLDVEDCTPGEHKLANGITITISEDKKSATIKSEYLTQEGYDGRKKAAINFVHIEGENRFICYYKSKDTPCSFENLTCPENKEISNITVYYAMKGDLTPIVPTTESENPIESEKTTESENPIESEKTTQSEKPVKTGDDLMLMPLLVFGIGAVSLFLSNKENTKNKK